MYVHVTTVIPAEVREDIKKRGWSIKDLLLQGYNFRMQNPGLIARISEQDTKIEKLTKRLAYYIGRLEEQEK